MKTQMVAMHLLI